MGDPHDIWLCTFKAERVNRTEITTSLLFDPRNNRFRIRVSQDFETQAKIEFSYFDADAYFASHPEYQKKAREGINDHIAKNPQHGRAMKAALTRMKGL